MEAAIPIASLAIAMTGTGYGMYAQKKAMEAANKGLPPSPELPKKPLNEDASMSAQVALAERQAQTAGGTILSNQADNRRNIGTTPNAPMKTLLGA